MSVSPFSRAFSIQSLLICIYNQAFICRKHFSSAYNCSVFYADATTVEAVLGKLVTEGQIRKVGRGRGTRYLKAGS